MVVVRQRAMALVMMRMQASVFSQIKTASSAAVPTN